MEAIRDRVMERREAFVSRQRAKCNEGEERRTNMVLPRD